MSSLTDFALATSELAEKRANGSFFKIASAVLSIVFSASSTNSKDFEVSSACLLFLENQLSKSANAVVANPAAIPIGPKTPIIWFKPPANKTPAPRTPTIAV